MKKKVGLYRVKRKEKFRTNKHIEIEVYQRRGDEGRLALWGGGGGVI